MTTTNHAPQFREILDKNFDADQPRNGVSTNLSQSQYRSMAGISPSDIKIASEELGSYKHRGHLYKLARSKVAQHCDTHQIELPPGMSPRPKKKCFDFGSLYHKVLLDPDHVDQEFAILDDQAKARIVAKRKERKTNGPDYPTDYNPRWKQSIAARKQAGRDLTDAEKQRVLTERQTEFIGQLDEFNEHVPEYTEWLYENRAQGKTLVSQSDLDHAHAMVDSLYHLDENSEVGELFAQMKSQHAVTEASLFFNIEYIDQLPSIQTKGRPDLLVDDLILDPKTCLCAHPAIFSRTVENYHYDFSMAMYLWLTEMLAGHPSAANLDFPKKRVGFLAQEKEPPYLARIYWLPTDWLNYKKEEVQIELSQIAQTWARGEWSQDLMRGKEQDLTPSRFLQYQIASVE